MDQVFFEKVLRAIQMKSFLKINITPVHLLPALCALLLFSNSVVNASKDTVRFHSRFEKALFDSASTGTTRDHVLLFALIDSDSSECVSMQNSLDRFYGRVLSPMLKGKNSKKKAKIIFDEVRRQFLRRYVDTAFFSRVFRDGTYNCVSGSALYAIVLGHYNIPYEIHELPTHIYVVANPNNDPILFESTSPRGYVQFSEKLKANVIGQLVNRNYITKEDVESVGASKAFDNYFFSKKIIDIINLAGVQYWNASIRAYTDQADKRGLEMIRRTQLLFPSERNAVVRTIFLDGALADSRFDCLDDIEMLVEYGNLSKLERNHKRVIDEFDEILHKNLILNSNKKFCSDACTIMVKKLTNKDMVAEVKRLRHTYFAKYYYLKNNADSALLEADFVYNSNPNNSEIQNLIHDCVFKKLQISKASPASIATLDQAVVKYKYLSSDAFVKAAYIELYARQSYLNFQANQPQPGMRYMGLLEKSLSAAPEVDKDEMLLGYVYAEAGSYLYRQHQYDSALRMMQHGLHFSPDHPEIKIRMQITREEMKAIADDRQKHKKMSKTN